MNLADNQTVDYAEEAFEKCNDCCCERLEKQSDKIDTLALAKETPKLFSSGSLEDNYGVGKMLGQGGFGVVYAGVRKKDKLKVAIKHIAKVKVTAMEMVNILKPAFHLVDSNSFSDK